MNLFDITISNRLRLAFAAVLLLMVGMVGFNWMQTTRIIRFDHEVADQNRKLTLAAQWRTETRLNLARALAIAKSGGDVNVKRYFSPLMADSSARISGIQKELEAMADGADEKALMQTLGDKRERYVNIRKAIFDRLSSARDDDLQEQIDQELVPAAHAYGDAMDAVTGRMDEAMRVMLPAMEQAAVAARRWNMILLAVAVCLAMVVATAMTSFIGARMDRAIDVARQVANGDLSEKSRHVIHADELGQLELALEQMQHRLRDLIGRIYVATDRVAVATEQISSGDEELASRTEQTARHLQETGADVRTLSESAETTARTAASANKLAHSAADLANRGGETVAKAVSSMDQMISASREMSDIISVIDAISFQTNLLALNAAVEAARAGPQGRGFAVVAAEVRNLAQRSAAAASQIKNLITQSLGRIESGGRQVQEAGNHMHEIVETIQRVASMMDDISLASRQQQAGIDRVLQTVGHLDDMTRQHVSLVEQSTAATGSLRTQTGDLHNAVSVFRVGHETA